MSYHHLSLYTKLITVVNKEDQQSMNKNYESPLATPFYHSIHLFEYPVNEFYGTIRMGAANHVRSNRTETDQ